MSQRYLTTLFTLLTLAGCTADGGGPAEPDLEDADPNALTWVAPSTSDQVIVGDPLDLIVSTENTDVHAVSFQVDGQSIGTCNPDDVTAPNGGDCNDDDMWRWTTTLTTPGAHHLVVSADLEDGTHVTTDRTVTAVAANAAGSAQDPGADDNEPDPLPAGSATGDEPVGVEVQSITAARGYLDHSHGWINHNGSVEWRLSGQRIFVKPRGASGDGRAEVGDVDDVAQCMTDYGDSIKRYADLGYVSRATVVALAVALTGCDGTPDDAPEGTAPVGLLQLPASDCVAEYAIASGTTLSEDECRSRMNSSPDFAIQVATLRLSRLSRRSHVDPVELAAEYTAGALRASRTNRFHLVAQPGTLDDFVEAYNAYRSWEGAGSAMASARAAAGTTPATFHDPCLNPGRNAIRHPGPDGVFRGTDGDDVIIGTNGDDEIHGGGGNDVICGRGGVDQIYGDDGKDYIDAGGGNDHVWGGAGNDTIHGRGGSDELYGGPDNDFIDGDILDDDLFGEAGNDTLIGGHGTDYLNGGENDDVLRGDTGRDTFIGGPGDDTISYATSTPHGNSSTTGINVDFNARLNRAPNDPTDGAYVASLRTSPHGLTPSDLWGNPTAGLSGGDGTREFVMGVEHIIGSSFNDRITHSPSTTGVTFDGGLGSDTCDGAACSGGEGPVPAAPYVEYQEHGDERGIVVMGGSGDDHLSVRVLSDGVYVQADDRSVHIAVPSGGPCRPDGGDASNIKCSTNGGALRYVVLWGGDGSDQLRIDGRYPRDMTAHFNGGTGDDELTGGGGEDVMFTGNSGRDHLRGNGSDDALLSEGGAAGGGDFLYAGRGDDQIVVDYICVGHQFRGGAGLDIAGFRRSGNDDIIAQLGGRISAGHIHHLSDGRSVHGRSFNPAVCQSDANAWTRMAPGLEILEASNGNDHLYGDDGPNVIWAWGGNDELHGYDGDDLLEGHDGDDDIYGDDGSDRMLGGPGTNDRLFAQDGRIDAYLSCGPGGGHLASHDMGEDAPDCH